MGRQAINVEDIMEAAAVETKKKKSVYILMISFDEKTSADNSTPKRNIYNFEGVFEKEENVINYCLHNEYVKNIEKAGFIDVVKLDKHKDGLYGYYHYEHGEAIDMENLKLMYELVTFSDPE